MIVGPQPRQRPLPRAGVLRLHYDPGALPARQEQVGHNRFDDPRPNSLDRYVVRYTASTLRGCLLESLAWLRPNVEAGTRESNVVDNAEPDDDHPDSPPAWVAVRDFLRDRQVGRLTGRGLRLLSINDPRLQAELDQEPVVRALLDSADGRTALASLQRETPRLDQAAVRLSTPFGRDLTQACSLAVWDRWPQPAGIHHRSRLDDEEDCWALFDHAAVRVIEVAPFAPETDLEHRRQIQEVANLWGMPIPPEWT